MQITSKLLRFSPYRLALLYVVLSGLVLGLFHSAVVEQSNFHNYRALRINETPRIDVHLVRSSEAPGGIGEPGTAVTAPALGNALYAATGKRVRKLPLRAAR